MKNSKPKKCQLPQRQWIDTERKRESAVIMDWVLNIPWTQSIIFSNCWIHTHTHTPTILIGFRCKSHLFHCKSFMSRSIWWPSDTVCDFKWRDRLSVIRSFYFLFHFGNLHWNGWLWKLSELANNRN